LIDDLTEKVKQELLEQWSDLKADEDASCLFHSSEVVVDSAMHVLKKELISPLASNGVQRIRSRAGCPGSIKDPMGRAWRAFRAERPWAWDAVRAGQGDRVGRASRGLAVGHPG
jgi:hypothetical protein